MRLGRRRWDELIVPFGGRRNSRGCKPTMLECIDAVGDNQAPGALDQWLRQHWVRLKQYRNTHIEVKRRANDWDQPYQAIEHAHDRKRMSWHLEAKTAQFMSGRTTYRSQRGCTLDAGDPPW